MQFLARFPGRWLALIVLAAVPTLTLPAQNTNPPVIVSSPATQTATAGQTVTLSVTAEGAAPLAYQWWFQTNALAGATANSLVLTNVNALQTGSYLAVVTNAFGSVTSAPAVLTVIGPPVIITQPTNQTVYVGQSATFRVTAFSRTPMTFQWQFQGNNLPDATNQTLTVGNVNTSNAGFYVLRISNNNGGVSSAPAELVVLPLPPSSLRLGVVSPTNSQIQVPVLFTAYGIETNLSFSIGWDPAVYSYAAFEVETDPSPPDDASARLRSAGLPPSTEVILDESLLAEGRLGVSLAWAPGVGLIPGESSIGQMLFNLVEGQENPLAGRLATTNQPVAALVAPPVLGTNGLILYGIDPQVVAVGPFTLDPQTGFLQQSILFANPGYYLADNARLIINNLTLGVDANTNGIALANAQGFLLPDFQPYVDFGAIASTEVRSGLLQYYVTDRRSEPRLQTIMIGTSPVNFQPPPGNLLTATVRRTNDMVLVEFPTALNFRYYIQYASSLTNLQSGKVETSLPSVRGTGSRLQWLDSGPPRTEPEVDEGELRFYQVLEVQ